MKRTEASCNDAKSVRQQYLNLSKRYADDTEHYELYINVSIIHLFRTKNATSLSYYMINDV